MGGVGNNTDGKNYTVGLSVFNRILFTSSETLKINLKIWKIFHAQTLEKWCVKCLFALWYEIQFWFFTEETAITTAEPLTTPAMTCDHPGFGTTTEDDPVLGPGCYISWTATLPWSTIRQNLCPDPEMIKITDKTVRINNTVILVTQNYQMCNVKVALMPH